MEQSPYSEANRFSVSQEILRILWNPEVPYRVDKSPPIVPVLSQINSIHAPPSRFLRSILILSSRRRLGFPSVLPLMFQRNL